VLDSSNFKRWACVVPVTTTLPWRSEKA
jgi:hypothetical protein